jgi:hypothetical protein
MITTFQTLSGSMPQAMNLKKIITSLKSNKSARYDEISNQILKLSAPYIVSPLTYIYIYNAALNSGIFPDRLKYAMVKPIHNKCSLQDFTNYRPISHLTAFSKILEN